MAKHCTHSIEFKRQVAQEFLAGETLHGLAKRHDVCRNLIRVWVRSTRPATFMRMPPPLICSNNTSPDRGARTSRRQAGAGARVSKGGCEKRMRPKSANTSVFVGPGASVSQKDAGCGNRPLDLLRRVDPRA